MSKLMVLFTLIATFLAYGSPLVAASPFVSYSTPVATVTYHQPALATVGAVVRTVPTSVSQASHGVIHKSEHVVHDVVSPVIKTTYTAPIRYASYATAPATYTSYAAASPYAQSV